MHGKIEGSTLTITLDINHECLASPMNGKYWPCEKCGKVEIVPMNVVSFVCYSCRHKETIFYRPDGECHVNDCELPHCRLCGWHMPWYRGHGPQICDTCRCTINEAEETGRRLSAFEREMVERVMGD